MAREHYLLVTGRLAEPLLRKTAAELAPVAGFDYSIAVLPITIAALMTTKWIARRLAVPSEITQILIPGYCQGDLEVLAATAGKPAKRGPCDLLELPDYFGQKTDASDYGDSEIEILARIARAGERPVDELVALARRLRDEGADIIHLAGGQGALDAAVRAVVAEGCRVSIDGSDARQVARAIAAGAELVFGVNKSTLRQARDWGRAVVAVPDTPGTLDGLDETVAALAKAKVPVRIDPGLVPIGFGLAESLGLYLEARRRWPEIGLAMDLGIVTETTEVDSAGLLTLLLGFCEEVGIHSVLVEQGANWARSAVRECDVARRLVHYAVAQHRLPRQLDARLVMLRDSKLLERGPEVLGQLAESIKDPSPRIFVDGGKLHLVAGGARWEGLDPYDLFEDWLPHAAAPLEPRVAFYLGYEMAKAAIANTLGKNYRQDDALDWGMLTVRELTRFERRALRMARRRKEEGCNDDGNGAINDEQ
jgi:hypothetical protein